MARDRSFGLTVRTEQFSQDVLLANCGTKAGPTCFLLLYAAAAAAAATSEMCFISGIIKLLEMHTLYIHTVTHTHRFNNHFPGEPG